MANYIRNLSAIAGAFFLCFAFISMLSPASAATFVFNLYDHPDGAISNADYGIRLDNSNPDQFFSFDAPGGAQLTVDTDAGTARILGEVSENDSNGNQQGLWEIDYTFNSGLIIDDLTGAFTATEGPNSAGTLKELGPNLVHDPDPLGDNDAVISLSSKENSSNLAMIFDDDGHRVKQTHADNNLLPLNCAPTTCWVGRGWIMGGGTNDFLFIATLESFQETVVPLPAALPLLLSGLGLMGWFSRRRKRAVAAA